MIVQPLVSQFFVHDFRPFDAGHKSVAARSTIDRAARVACRSLEAHYVP